MSTWFRRLVERQNTSHWWGRGPPEVLKAYIGEVVWRHPPKAVRQGLHGDWRIVDALLPCMARVVVVGPTMP